MITRRSVIAAAAALPLIARTGFAAAAAEPAATVQGFYDVLLATMKDGPKLGFAGRRDRLAPAMRQAFDLPLMTRLVVGPQWQGFTPEQQRQVIAGFSDFSIANYASQFDDYSGEKFVVDPKSAPAPGNDAIVRTKLLLPSDKPVQLDYLLRSIAGKWRIIDVYLSGTVSQLAARRSEFSAVLRRDGVEGLITRLKEKTKQLASG
ncbi:MAG: ABC transporter substrate-binding protein [Stellaceae bacterium]